MSLLEGSSEINKMDPFSESSDMKEGLDLTNSNSKSFTILPKKKWIITLIIVLILLFATVGIVLLIFFLAKKSDEIKISEIVCNYSISELNASILSSEYENKNNIVIEIYFNDNKIDKIDYIKEYAFPSEGNYTIKYILNGDLFLDNMFKNIDSVQSIEFKNLSNSNVKILSMKSTFEGCKNLDRILFTESFDTSELKSTSKLFYNSGIKEINFNKFDTKNVEDMSYMFSHCESLTSLNLDNFSTQNALIMSYMFSDLNLTNIPIINLETRNVKSMDYMFSNDYLVTILNTSNFNTENVQTMKGMFYNCSNLEEVYPQAFNTTKVTDFDYMFKNCKSIRELNLTSFYTVNCNKFNEMFDGCPRMKILILDKIDAFENLLEVMLNSEVNIKFKPEFDYYDDY